MAFGPQHGPVTEMQVQECLRAAYRRGYDELVFAGFSFDGTAQADIQAGQDEEIRIHMAHINPDVTMGDLLKETPLQSTVHRVRITTHRNRNNGGRGVYRQDGGGGHIQSRREYGEFRRR